jgi:hypothetical protein
LTIFTVFSLIPFIHITEIIGLETFLDSFENSHNYLCIQDKENMLESNTNGDYLIIQKPSHPDFKIDESDQIIYCSYDGDISYTKVHHINFIASIKRYYIEEQNEEIDNNIIFHNQILGKIVYIIDDNILNSISIKIWETSINNLNLRSLLID